MDFIISKGARELFTDAELDILVVTLTHTLENDAGIEVIILSISQCTNETPFLKSYLYFLISTTQRHWMCRVLYSMIFIQFRLEALKTIHRILTILKTAPSALDRLHHITREMLTQADASGGNKNGCYRGVLKKIYKIAVLS